MKKTLFAPVCDFKSWPGGKGKGPGSKRDWASLIELYGLSSAAEALAYEGTPIDLPAPLAEANMPLIHVVSDADEVVPVEENTAVLQQRYTALGGTITVFHKPNCGHHLHGLRRRQARCRADRVLHRSRRSP